MDGKSEPPRAGAAATNGITGKVDGAGNAATLFDSSLALSREPVNSDPLGPMIAKVWRLRARGELIIGELLALRVEWDRARAPPKPERHLTIKTKNEHATRRAFKMRVQVKTYDPIPSGEYLAKIAEIAAEPKGTFGPQFKFKFDILEPKEFDSKSLVGWTSQNVSPKSKFYGWARAAFGGTAIPPKAWVNTDDLVGRKVRLQVVIARSDSGEEYNKITDVTPPRAPKNTEQEQPVLETVPAEQNWVPPKEELPS